MDAEKRPKLPALSFLDADPKKYHEDSQHSRNVGMPLNPSTQLTTSSTSRFSPGPPRSYPPFGPPASTLQYPSSWQAAPLSITTPPGSRRTSHEEKEDGRPPTRQLLPSISEALGVDNPKPFSGPPPLSSSSASSLGSTALPKPQTTTPSSPSATSIRSFAVNHPRLPQKSFPPPTYTPSPYRPEQAREAVHVASTQPARTPHAPVQELHAASHPPHSQAPAQPAHAASFPRPSEPSLKLEQPFATSSAGPPPPEFSHGYTQYPPRYNNQPPPANAPAGSAYQPTPSIGAPTAGSSSWKPDGPPPPHMEERLVGPGGNFGDSVKRHLDFYDLELALNDISHSSGILTDFARRYGDRMHMSQRSGTPLNTLPSIVEIDDMISKSRVEHDALIKIREVILAQQAAYEQQAADQRQQQKHFGEQAQTPASDSQQRMSDDDKSGGFAGADHKKRRGRAAPPGRCHSCNRAETPEWRRGPDGARTLCNACGLHYAKLTRKSNYAKQNASLGGSNLRPKENAS